VFGNGKLLKETRFFEIEILGVQDPADNIPPNVVLLQLTVYAEFA
jgi:hypothetical protein